MTPLPVPWPFGRVTSMLTTTGTTLRAMLDTEPGVVSGGVATPEPRLAETSRTDALSSRRSAHHAVPAPTPPPTSAATSAAATTVTPTPGARRGVPSYGDHGCSAGGQP